MKTISYNKKSYKPSILNNGWKYTMRKHKDVWEVIGLNADNTKQRISSYQTREEAKIEFDRLTKKPVGRKREIRCIVTEKTAYYFY